MNNTNDISRSYIKGGDILHIKILDAKLKSGKKRCIILKRFFINLF